MRTLGRTVPPEVGTRVYTRLPYLRGVARVFCTRSPDLVGVARVRLTSFKPFGLHAPRVAYPLPGASPFVRAHDRVTPRGIGGNTASFKNKDSLVSAGTKKRKQK